MVTEAHGNETTLALPQRNRQIRLAARPRGIPVDSDWEFTERPVAAPEAGEILVRILLVSLDPAMRVWINGRHTYIPPIEPGDLMNAYAIGCVVQSRNTAFAEGTYVTGFLGVQEYAVSDGRGLLTVDPSLAPLHAYLGVLGTSGLSAYFGLFDVGRAEAGDTVVVSGAAGSVGEIVGQLAKLRGCRVIGIAGGAAKCARVVDELGFDACIDYHSEEVAAAIAEHCPRGADVYFDNVGGEILEAALANLRRGARVVLCGAISQYNEGSTRGPRNYLELLVKRASMTGFLVFDYATRFPEATRELAGWLDDGRLGGRMDVHRGLERFPSALRGLFTGANNGKAVLRIADYPGADALDGADSGTAEEAERVE